METVVARKMLRTLEPYHGWVYFSPEPREEYAKLGVTDARMAYFASRSAPMGAVSADVTIATFFNFNPDLVKRSIPAAWDITTPAALIDARLRGADAMLRRVLDEAIDSPEMREAADLAQTAASACRPEGRPLYAGHAGLSWPEEPHLVLWHAQTLLREFRGDGHIIALTAAQLDACEALVTHAASGDVPADALRRSRSWSEEDWSAAVERLHARGIVESDGTFTDAGQAQREEIETLTDQLAMAPWLRIGPDACTRLRELVRPWSRAIVGSGGGLASAFDD